MRIVIDMQGAQTESRFRGIGRYTMSLAQAFVRNRGEHEVYLALSGLFPDTIGPIRAAFDGLLPPENIRVWYAPGLVRECDASNTWRREVAELIREAFLASLKPDVVHVTSLFEGYVDDAVTSIGKFDQTTPVCVTIYDLIPFLNQNQYLTPNPPYAQYYHRKVEYLHRASLLLAISESARNEGLDCLAVATESITNISGAADVHFRPMEISDDQAAFMQNKHGISRPFLLYTGGADERKNLPRLIRAYAELSDALRETHQLVFAGRLSEGQVHNLQTEAKTAGLLAGELCFTGYVSDDELVQLYNLCKLFVFPSWHEGFGLPALEAMACGVPAIGANTSSVPEVIGLESALFDPFDVSAIAQKITHVLEDDCFRGYLRTHGLEQVKRFSWEESARRAIVAFELLAQKTSLSTSIRSAGSRPKLAFVSPLPPERSGISDYSAELLPELARHYDIDVVVAQSKVSDPWILENLKIRSVEWFRENAESFDRVLYQFGNSSFHSHMFGLLNDYPGVVVLHDFFLSGVLAYEEITGGMPGVWSDALYHSHGYTAVKERFDDSGIEKAKEKYPANLSVLQQARSLIFHSDYSLRLFTQWYGQPTPANWKVIPLLRTQHVSAERKTAREEFHLSDHDFVVCSFGFLDSTKLNHRLLQAWLSSELAKDPRCVLIFVGENHGGDYGRSLLRMIEENGLKNRIRITGWVDQAVFRRYLAAADIGVQLRCLSRGETSAAVLDCMNFGLPTIVNANGSMGDLPNDAVLMLPDEFSDRELVDALESLYRTPDLRKQLSSRARGVILTHHTPVSCAEKYVEAIESAYAETSLNLGSLIRSVADKAQFSTNPELAKASQAIADSIPLQPRLKQLLVDVTSIAQDDLKTGIERVVRAQLLELLKNPPAGFRVEPVYLSKHGGRWCYWYARNYTCRMLGIGLTTLSDCPVDLGVGDVFYGADFAPHVVAEAMRAGLYQKFKALGVSTNFQVYDLLPVLSPKLFPEGASSVHTDWLKAISSAATRLICISGSVAIELQRWISENISSPLNVPEVTSVQLGADIEASAPTIGFPEDAHEMLCKIKGKPTFLMVGTIEPRKGHLQTLAAFDILWKQGIDANLVIVGHEGWKALPDSQRRTIPEVVAILSRHSELGKRLFWLSGVSDEYLEKIYAESICLIAASEGEGFGLPLIEAAKHGLPIIARDIPVFREIVGVYATYFDAMSPANLAYAIMKWLEQGGDKHRQRLDNFPWITWKQNADSLKNIFLKCK